MSLDDISDEVYFKWLSEASNFFNSRRNPMKDSARIVDDMLNLIKSTISSIDKTTLSKLFTDLQDTVDVEFSRNGSYEAKILKKLQDQFRKSMKDYLSNMQNVFQTSSRFERLKQRKNSSDNVETLRFLITRDPPVDSKKLFIGLSYAYANYVNGVFRFSLQDCYAWERISNGDVVDSESLSKKDVADIKEFYKQRNDLLYFEGYDSIVRNAVAHSNFEYDDSTQKITYVNERNERNSQTGQTSLVRDIVSYNFQEMIEKYEKLEKIYELILCMNRIILVTTSCKILSNRHP